MEREEINSSQISRNEHRSEDLVQWGAQETTIKTNLTFDVQYDDGAIANIPSLWQVTEKYQINFKIDDQGSCFIVSTKMGELTFLRGFPTWTWEICRISSTREDT